MTAFQNEPYPAVDPFPHELDFNNLARISTDGPTPLAALAALNANHQSLQRLADRVSGKPETLKPAVIENVTPGELNGIQDRINAQLGSYNPDMGVAHQVIVQAVKGYRLQNVPVSQGNEYKFTPTDEVIVERLFRELNPAAHLAEEATNLMSQATRPVEKGPDVTVISADGRRVEQVSDGVPILKTVVHEDGTTTLEPVKIEPDKQEYARAMEKYRQAEESEFYEDDHNRVVRLEKSFRALQDGINAILENLGDKRRVNGGWDE